MCGMLNVTIKKYNMKKIFLVLFLICTIAACNKNDVINRKPGVFLPPVSNLSLQKIGEKGVKIAWDIPSIPSEIEQPVSAIIQVVEKINNYKYGEPISIEVPKSPTEFSGQVPDPAKIYYIIVKLKGYTKVKDKNYSGEIYSLGQTVEYNK